MTTFIFRLAPLIVLLSLNCFGQGYQLTDLGALTGTNSYAQGINNQQQVVGYWDTTNGTHAFLYNAGAITDLGTLGGLNSYALNINSAGQIVGFSQTPEGVGAFLYGSGGMTNLGTLGGLDSYGFGINDTADIVGCIETTNGFQAILLSNGEVTQLGTLGGTNSFAYSVNLTRQVAGTSLTADNVSPNAFLWQDNLLTNLNDLLPLGSGWQLQEARAINNAGQIVGWGLLDSVKHAFLFSSNTIIDLGILPGGTNSYALGLNNSNQVVGASTISNGVLHGFLWDNGTLKDLNNSLPTNSGWELREATAINDQGQIAGWGTNQGSESAFLMTPSPLPSSSSLQLWFRADEGVVTDTNGNVSQWLDQSGNGNHASQTVTAAEPLLATNVVNGQPVVRFNGTSDFLSFPAVNTTNFTIFIVYRMTGHQAWAGPLENRAAGLYGFEVTSGSADTSVYEPELVESFGSQELADETTGVGLSLPLGPVLQEWTSDERFFQDGLERSVINGATGWDVSGGRLGYAWSYMAGDIAEVLVYNTVLSDTDRQGVENYLNGKYAVLSAPPAPVISPPGGTYPGSVTVTLSTPALGTQLYYTTDGSQPTTNSTLYTGAFNLSSNATVTAVSYLNGMASATTNEDFAVSAGGAPTAATGLALWFRADVGVITDTNGNVSQWLDESGNGNHASQTVAAAEPVLATNAINGEPVVRFNGTSDCLSFPAVNTTNFTVFIVYRMTGHQAWAGPLENRAAGLYGFEVASGSADTSVYEPELVESLGSQELADITTGVATSLPLGPVLQEWTSGERFFQDGLEQTVVNGATGWDVSGGRLGYAWSYMAGDIAEVLVYNMVLSDTDRQGVESYLNGKYAVLTPPPAPVISPDGGTYPGSVTVTLSTPALGTQLYYTTDGSQPTTNSTFYAGPFNLSSNATVTAVSYLNGMASATTNADFAVTTGSAPTAATGLAFWFRADAGVITDGSGNVSQWLDQSGNGIHASQTAATAKPVLATNAINGEPAVRFNGTSDYLGFPAVNTTNFTVFIVYRMTGHQAWAGPLENRAAGLYGFELGSGSADTSVYEPELVESFGSQELADKTTGVGLSLPMGPVLQEWTSDERFFQGGLEQSVINGATGWDVSGGRLGYAWSYMAGDIAEVLVYNTVLSDTDRQGVENYLNGKYAVLSAPPAPVISPPGGTYPGSVTVTLSTPALGTQLYYTTDGSQPTTNSTLYTGAFNLSSNATVTAVSYLNAIGSATTNAEFAVTTGSAPTAATGLAFWFRADEGVITNGNGNVSQWLDESGNGNHASQTTMAAEPLLATNAINGEPVIRFNGTSDYLSFPAVNTTNFTIFIVYRMTGHQAWAGPLENRAAGLYGFELGSASADTSVYEPELVESFGSQELADITTGVGLSLPLGPVLQEWTSGARFFQDGLEQTVVNGATGWDVSGGRLGYAWSYMAGDIAEVLVYNTVLSDTDRQGVENYLNGKYAVLTPPPAPVISPAGGTYPGSVTVTLSTPALGTQLYYTTDGSQPTTNSTLYTGAFNLSSNATVTAVSYLNGMASTTTNAEFAVTAGSAPTTAAGLAFWFRADMGVIADGNENVSQWLDESGNGNHASQTVMAAEPVLATNAINGEPVVRFNGTSDCLSFPAVNTTNFTVFIVYRMTGHQAWAGPLENRAAGLYGFEVASGSADTSVYEPELVESFGSQELADITTGVATSLPLGPVLQEWTSDERFFQDGLEQSVVNGATGWDVSGGRLGYAWSYMAGDIAEVLVYNTVLSDADRQGVENYLNGKYFNSGNTNDYYNGNLPDITIIGGNNQSGLTNSWLPTPLTVQLTDTNALILTNAPVTFAVTQGSALIANSINGTTTNVLQIVTDLNGQAAVWLQLPPTIGTNIVTVSAQSETNVVQVNFAEIAQATGGASAKVAIGGERTMELTANGDVVSWGGNQFGELGDFTHLDSETPVHVVGLTNLTLIASGLSHSLAIDSGGALWAWGDDTYGQLGDGNENTNSNVPVMVLGMSNSVVAVAAGYNNSVAVKSDGTVWTWGNPYEASSPILQPTQMAGLSNVVSIAGGYQHTLALLTNGTVYAWGADGSDQLGDGLGIDSPTPVQVPGLSNIVAICAGGYHSLAIDTNGNVWSWGQNDSGQLGNGQSGGQSDGVINLSSISPGFTNITQIAAGTSHSLALDSSGRLWAWGSDAENQLGDGGTTDQDQPEQIVTVSNVLAIAAGSDASVAIDTNHNLWEWGSSDGDNGSGNEDWVWGNDDGLPDQAPQYADYYNGQLPILQILSGNNQTPHATLEFDTNLVLLVTDTNGVPLINAPVTAEIITGDMQIRTNSGGINLNGIRATTDSNGEVSLIGYALPSVVFTNGDIRILAASRQLFTETNITETLVPAPTITITSPVNFSSVLVNTNGGIPITVSAQAGAGGSIQEVDYSYELAGGDPPIGVSTTAPFSFDWISSMWTNDINNGFILFAVAIDNKGVASDPASAYIFNVLLDTDGGGLPDYWQIDYFGLIGEDPGSDPYNTGNTLLYDYQNGIDPTGGNLPNLTILSGNNQAAVKHFFSVEPLVVGATYGNSNILAGVPITFTAENGDVMLAANTNDLPAPSLSVQTDSNGNAQVWAYFVADSTNSVYVVSASATSGAPPFANTASVTFDETEINLEGYWRFNDTNWMGEEGQEPLGFTNLNLIPDWSVNALKMDTNVPAYLAYNTVETNGLPNIAVTNGAVQLWFKPDWSSSTTNNGTGPGSPARLIEMGSEGSADGWWALLFNADGTALSFVTETNDVETTNLIATINWSSNDWHQIVLAYAMDNSALYVDGQAVVTNGLGVTSYPDATALTNGFFIGSDSQGNNQADGLFDELKTFNSPDIDVLHICRLAPPTISLIMTNDGDACLIGLQPQTNQFISAVNEIVYPEAYWTTKNYADSLFAREYDYPDSGSFGINISKLPPPLINPTGGYFNNPYTVTLSLGAADLTNLVKGLYHTELARDGGNNEIQTVVAYAQTLRGEGYTDEQIRANLINGTYFRSSVEYHNDFGFSSPFYPANTNDVIQYSLNNGASWNIYANSIQLTGSQTLLAREVKGTTSDERTQYAYLTSDPSDAEFEYIPAGWLIQYFGTNYQNNPNADPYADPNLDGLNNLQDYQTGINPTTFPNLRLGYWRFNNTNWMGEEGQQPLGFTNLSLVPDWSVNALGIDTNMPAFLNYRTVETNGDANITCFNGSVRFWFKPDWNSSTTNSGAGPGSLSRLIEMGSQGSIDGWWTLAVSADGTTLEFITQNNGAGMTNLNATINWTSNDWHQVVLAYSTTNSSLYLDGQVVVTNGLGVTDYPDATALAGGFYIGSDNAGNNQAAGQFDELETFNYPLSEAEVITNYNLVDPGGAGPIDYIGYLEGLNPSVHGASIADTNGIVNLQLYTPLQ